MDGPILRVRVIEEAPAKGLFLWVRRAAAGQLLEALVTGLAGLKLTPLTEAFAQGRLSPVPPDPGTPTGRNPEQRRARAACCAPGLHVVWGPPGTGKTAVIVDALGHLVAQGKSVLLVSGTNVAVDNALHRAARDLDPTPGALLRIGTPHMPEVAEDQRICLAKLQQARLGELERRRTTLVEKITEVRGDQRIHALEEAHDRLEGFAADRYEAARVRLGQLAELERLRGELDAARAESLQAVRRERHATEEEQRTVIAWEETSETRHRLEDARKIEQELAGLQLELDRAETVKLRAEQEWRRWDREMVESENRSRLWRSTHRAVLRSLSDSREAARRELAEADARLARMSEIAFRSSAELRRRRAGLLQQVVFKPAEIERRADRRIQAEARRLESRQAVARAEQEVGVWERSVAEAERRPLPEPEDADLVRRADAEGLPRLYMRRPQLEAEARPALTTLAELEKEHEKLLAEQRRMARDAERELIDSAQVIATTHAMLRMRPSLRERRYDFVLVDEAAASTPAEVLYAVSRAELGTTLLGDSLQNGPIVTGALAKSREECVQKWLRRDPFEAVGVFPRAADQPGCVMLTRQYRFGKSINELANRVAYEGRLAPGTGKRDEIVFIDVDGLGDQLAGVQRVGSSRSWPIGPLLAKALAQHHLIDNGERAVGVVTPYKPHRQLLADSFADAGLPVSVEAGTVHSFQGREFETVIFDLVEDGNGWLSSSELDAVRVFNVGATRAEYRLYVIASRPALSRARPGSPLSAVRDMIRSGTVQTVSASALLGTADLGGGSGVLYELWDAVRSYARVVSVLDEEVLPEALLDELVRAERSIWLWSPWTARAVRGYLPALTDAVDRGVDVRVITRPSYQVNSTMQPYVAQLAAMLPHVVFLKDQHQKLAVIDERLTFIGSMNVLSHAGTKPREIMSVLEGRGIAARMLEHERADQLVRPPSCPSCQEQAEYGVSGRGRQRGLRWFCRKNCFEWSLPFPDRAGGRNQSRRT
ncbi:AAA domain-containing protein [Planomonospora parontospora]|uniref:AAA domain-containing protein n=1 Tax=Planomonospora parontospora TaxID=58119 RepID=UPI00167162D9|nr:AAA domain-containing protein [Planomonospora parontospora]GII19973.1 hypothetical protein Ppa05_66990 [Planomonospora parontospora subsp. antibiotica]